jgi:hypothetical protein
MPVTYTDFEGKEVTEEIHFNLSKAELAEMTLVHGKDLAEYLRTIVAKDDTAEVVRVFKEILMLSVGKRIGPNFVKSQEVKDGFLYSGAYSVVFMKLLTDANFSAEFVNGIMPEDLKEKAQEQMKVELPADPQQSLPTPDFTKMNQEQFLDWQRRQRNPLGI